MMGEMADYYQEKDEAYIEEGSWLDEEEDDE
jgi:hypothetical protein